MFDARTLVVARACASFREKGVFVLIIQARGVEDEDVGACIPIRGIIIVWC